MRKILFIITSLLILTGIGVYYVIKTPEATWNIKYSISQESTHLDYEAMKAQLEETAQKNIDLYNTAIRENNAKLCDGISLEKKKFECLDMTKINIAKKDGNIEICNSMNSNQTTLLCKDIIQGEIAVSKSEITLCESINEKNRKEFCQDSITENLLKKQISEKTVSREFCAGLNEKFQSNCFKEIQSNNDNDIYREAIIENSITLCKKIQTIDTRDNCTDSVYLKLATNTENNLLCDNIINQEKSQYCKEQLNKTNDISRYKSAISSNQRENCKNIANNNLQNRCNDIIIFNLVKAEQNKEYCANLTNTGLITSCEQLIQE